MIKSFLVVFFIRVDKLNSVLLPLLNHDMCVLQRKISIRGLNQKKTEPEEDKKTVFI